MASDSIDIEKGLVTEMSRPTIPSWASSAPQNADQALAHTPLELFQLLAGIHTPSSLEQEASRSGEPKSSRARSDNVGLYQRAKDGERRSRIQYTATSIISNTLLMVQILIAATFTGLSAYKKDYAITLTVLGAINTVLAGCIAWQKGQGVPQRYRKAMEHYQGLIIEIEMAERSFLDVQSQQGEDGAQLDPRKVITRLQKLFDTARADEQANYPDLYVSTGQLAAKQAKDMEKQLEDAKAQAAKVQGEMMAKIQEVVAGLEGKVDAHVAAR